MRGMDSNATLPERQKSLGVLIKLVRAEFVRAIEKTLEDEGFDLRFSQMLVIKHLAVHGTVSLSALARHLEHDAGALTRMVDQLEHKGYLHRYRDSQDRRVVRVELTECGHALWKQINLLNQRVLEQAHEGLTEHEQKKLHGYLESVLSALKATHGSPSSA